MTKQNFDNDNDLALDAETPADLVIDPDEDTDDRMTICFEVVAPATLRSAHRGTDEGLNLLRWPHTSATPSKNEKTEGSRL